MSVTGSKTITDLIETRLKTVSGVAYYRSDVEDHPPTFPDSDRVAPYLVLYPFPGKQTTDLTLCGSADRDYGCQVTCAAGFSADCERLVDRVEALLSGWAPVIDNVSVGSLRPPPGYDPGPVRIDRSIIPPRFSVPLQYRLTAAT